MRSSVWISALWVVLAATATVSFSSHAAATIVYNGREVSAWPDLEQPSTPPAGGAFDVVGAPGIHLFSHPSGVVHGLTILVDFSDQTGAYSKDEINAWLNTKGYNKFGLTGSVRDYYLQQSNGKVDYQNEVHGFYRAQKPKSYYQGGDGYERADELWEEVSQALDGEIDYSKFDNDGDGKTEAISLLYAGNEGTFGKGLWPHASSSNDTRDGVHLNRYMMTAMDDQPTNYVFSHESGHMLFGWPDMYGVGDYSIMANRDANTNPVGIDDVLRADQGWVDIVDVTSTTNARYEAAPNGVVYRYVNPARPTEYFLWSNVQNTDEWVSLAGGGLLIWHFDKSIGGNNPPQPLEIAVVQGGGSRILSATTWPSPGSAKTDFFGAGVNSEVGAQTKPASSWNDGSASGLRIYDIGESGPSIAFSVGTGPISTGGSGGAGGAAGGSATAGMGGVGAASAGMGGAGFGGSAGASGGSLNGGSGASFGGAANTNGGHGGNSPSGGSSAAAGQGAAANGAAGGNVGDVPPNSDSGSGCSCSVARQTHHSDGLGFGLLGLALTVFSRRRRAARARAVMI